MIGRVLALVLIAVPASAATVTLKPGAAERLGIVVQPLAAAATASAAAGQFGVAAVVDTSPLLQLIGDLVTAKAAAAASAADYRRQSALYHDHQDVSQRTAEVARAAAAADAAKVQSTSGLIAVQWSPALANPSPALAAALRSGRAHLVRLEAVGRLAAGRHVRLGRSDGTHIEARVLGPAAGASVASPGPAWLAIADDSSLHAGEPLSVAIYTSPPQAGAFLPRGAALMVDGHYSYYEASGSDRFTRLPFPPGYAATGGGWRIAVPPGRRVVTGGAAALLAAEHAVAAPAKADD